MDRIEFGKRLISEVSDARQKLVDAQKHQQNIKDKLNDRKDIAKQNKLKRDASVVRKGIADKVRKSNFSKASTTSVDSKDKGATAMQKGAGNLIKTGVAAAKNVVKGVAKTAVGVHDLRRGAQKRGLDRAKLQHARAKERTEKAQKAFDDDRPFAPPKSKPQTYRSKREEPKKSEPKRLPAAKDPKRKQISGGAERKALPAAKPRKFGTDSDGTPSKGTLARSSKKIRRGMMQQREEFIQEIEEKEDKKKDKLEKIIDIMRGKNKITINPDVKEEVKTENWKDDYVATEYETVDIIKPEPLNASDWRKELDSLRP